LLSHSPLTAAPCRTQVLDHIFRAQRPISHRERKLIDCKHGDLLGTFDER
jgi:hypothetical protein